MVCENSRLLRRRFSGVFIALLYIIFGLTDLLLSLAAFALGVLEGNPLLAWLAGCGLFVPAKILLTLAAALLIVLLYSRAGTRPFAHSAVLAMAMVDLYHIWALRALLTPG